MVRRICLAGVIGLMIASSCCAQEKFTPQLAKEKVNAAVRLFVKDGKTAFQRSRGFDL